MGGYYGAGSKLLWTGSDGDVHRAGVHGQLHQPRHRPSNLAGSPRSTSSPTSPPGRTGSARWRGGLSVNFTPAIDVITGPVWFLDNDLYKGTSLGSNFAWTVQLDVDFDLRPPKPPAPAKA